MKALTHLYDEIVSLKNLFQAAKATMARGRRFYGEGAVFKFNLEREVFRLHEQLVNGKYRHGRYQIFEIRDPKPRTIAAAKFRDRVLHHAVHDVIEPKVDRMFIHDSYACRTEKGTQKALGRAQSFIRANQYAIHLDVKSYFQNINHDILKSLLKRIVNDARTMELLEMIIDSTRYLAMNGYEKAGKRRISEIAGTDGQLSLFEDDFCNGALGDRALPLKRNGRACRAATADNNTADGPGVFARKLRRPKPVRPYLGTQNGRAGPSAYAGMLRRDRPDPPQSRAEQSRAEQSRAEQSRAEQSRAEQSREDLPQPCPA